MLNWLIEDLSKCDYQPEQIKLNQKQIELLNDIHFDCWDEYASPIKATLKDLALDYIRSERVEGSHQEYRDMIVLHIRLLNALIDLLHDLKLDYIEVK